MTAPVVVKLGGDALASPQRIVAQARRLAARARAAPVVAVVSARRGVTDHLLQLTGEVAELAWGEQPDGSRAAAEADRAVASGEVVSASLLALALNRLGVEAVSLDAREAGVRSRGEFGAAHIRSVDSRPIRRLLDAGVIPVVTGYQGWWRGRVTTIGRGGTDASAVALGRALAAARVVLVKDAAGLRSADPKLVPEAALIAEAPHQFLAALALAGSKVIQAEAALLAQRASLPLEFWSLDGDHADTLVHAGASPEGLVALATPPDPEASTISVIVGQPESLPGAETLQAALAGMAEPVRLERLASGWRVTVSPGCRGTALRALHHSLASACPPHFARRAS